MLSGSPSPSGPLPSADSGPPDAEVGHAVGIDPQQEPDAVGRLFRGDEDELGGPSPILASTWPSSTTRTRVAGSSHAFASQSALFRSAVDRSTSCAVSAIPPDTDIWEPATASEYVSRHRTRRPAIGRRT